MSNAKQIISSMRDGSYNARQPEQYIIDDLIDIAVSLSYDIEKLKLKIKSRGVMKHISMIEGGEETIHYSSPFEGTLCGAMPEECERYQSGKFDIQYSRKRVTCTSCLLIKNHVTGK